MLDLQTKKWTDKEGNQTYISELGDAHLIYIQRYLRRIMANKDSYIAQRQTYWEGVACAYDAYASDKDWYSPGGAFRDIEGAGEEDFDKVKVALMLISQEVKKRKLPPLESKRND